MTSIADLLPALMLVVAAERLDDERERQRLDAAIDGGVNILHLRPGGDASRCAPASPA